MRNSTKLSLSFILLALWAMSAHAQKFTFAIAGSTWLYKNEGRDTTVKYIRISRDGSKTIKVWYGLDSPYPVNTVQMREELLTADSTIKRSSYFYLDSFNVYTGYIQMQDTTGIEQQLYCWDFVHPFKPWDPARSTYSKFYYYKNDSVDSITVNGHWLRIGFDELPPTFDSCYNFCGPIVERIGNLGFFFPAYMCSMDTFYAGHLLWYQDPEIGRWNVPDSLRSPCAFHYPSSVNPFEKPLSELRVYPNPSHDLLYIQSTAFPSAPISVSIYNIAGQRVLSYDKPLWPLDVSTLPKGLYILQLQGSQGVVEEKFLKE